MANGLEANSQAGSEGSANSTPQSDPLDVFRIGISRTDFNKIDEIKGNGNYQLSAEELTKARESGEFKGEALESINGFINYLKENPTRKGYMGTTVPSAIDDWINPEFAITRMTKDEFKRVDSNKDHVLSASELKAGLEGATLSAPGKFASKLFLDLLENMPRDDKRNIVHQDGINDWSQLNPDLTSNGAWITEDMTSHEKMKKTQLDVAVENIMRGKSHLSPEDDLLVLDEKIKRLDFGFKDSDFEEAMSLIPLLLTSLDKTGQRVELGPDDKFRLSDKEKLREFDRLNYHDYMMKVAGSTNEQVQMRLLKAGVLSGLGRQAEAVEATKSAIQKADRLSAKFSIDGKDVRYADLLYRQSKQILDDAPVIRSELKNRSPSPRDYITDNAQAIQDELLPQPVYSRLALAQLYLGCTKTDTKGTPVFDTKSPVFDPAAAEKVQDQSKQYSADFLKYESDAFSASGKSSDISLFGRQWASVDPKGKYNFYADKNRNGESDLVERVKELKRYNLRAAQPKTNLD